MELYTNLALKLLTRWKYEGGMLSWYERKVLQLKVSIGLKKFIPEQKFQSNMAVESNKVMKMWSWDTEGQTDANYEKLDVIGLG